MRIVILHDELPEGASADQRDVLAQVAAITQSLHELGHHTEVATCSLNLESLSKSLAGLKPDRVFNLVESVGGRGRLIYLVPALLDALSLSYTGAGTEAMFQTSCKTLTKLRLRENGLDTPDWISPEAGIDARFNPGRYIVKSVWEDASIGLDEDSVIDAARPDVLLAEIERRRASLGGQGFAEAFVDGREFNFSVLAGRRGPEVLPPAEIEFVNYGPSKPRVVGYRAKWDESSFEYQHTRRRFELSDADSPLMERMKRIAGDCWRLFGLRGWARVDFRVDATGRHWVLEINANPCLSPDAGFAAAAERAGISYTSVIERILGDAGTGEIGG